MFLAKYEPNYSLIIKHNERSLTFFFIWTDTPKENGDSYQPMLLAADHEVSTETS